VTLVMVSHNLVQIVRNTSIAILLVQGRIVCQSTPGAAVKEYGRLTPQLSRGVASAGQALAAGDARLPRHPICELALVGADGSDAHFVELGESVTFRFVLDLGSIPQGSVLGFRLRKEDGLEIAGTNTRLQHLVLPFGSRERLVLDYRIPRLLIAPSRYSLTAELTSSDYSRTYGVLPEACEFEVLPTRSSFGVGVIDLGGQFTVRASQAGE